MRYGDLSLSNISDSEQSSSSIIEGAISAEEFLHRERETKQNF